MTSHSKTFRPDCGPIICFGSPTRNVRLVVGTGDLSELALGWCTYGVGDQMSHYNVNASVAKTLFSILFASLPDSGEVDEGTVRVLHAILATVISPELVPTRVGEAIQSSEKAIGPYRAAGLQPLLPDAIRISAIEDRVSSRIMPGAMSSAAFGHPTFQRHNEKPTSCAKFDIGSRCFSTRFFANQFKRSALPNGPKISSGGSLSPRGDWRAPSDASADVWLAELAENVPET